ncbi:hypothetical protein [Roseomonas xinghualingensis]|uniref:hypothetical protein n=1 Tax=Roseomonas xinghualingensis TaxID=2986475 RepID=UPI0021F1265D|nr:hypothetical protein [Roseomonas sp. SXEYE001]MCV4210365.1 hypothetical protein [Roseomonas sp. SXEYE001]
MKINAKDVWAGGFLVFIALFGLFINGGLFGIGLEQHALGSARRMGPGYMPMLVFWLQFALGALVIVAALNSGPDPLERWNKIDAVALASGIGVGLILWQLMERTGATSGWMQVGLPLLVGMLILSISPAWRALGLTLGSFVAFGLALETLGLIFALVALCGISALADREHTLKSTAGMTVFLCILAWFVFIYELDVRIPLWPTIF